MTGEDCPTVVDPQHRSHRRLAVVGAFVLFAVSALVIASAAGGAIRTVTFDDLPANTRVSTEYQSSHGVTFVSHEGIRPLVKPFPGKAHSGDRVGVYTCEGLPGCGEGFFDPQLRGTLTTTATSVSAYVGYWDNPAFPGGPDSFMVRIRAYNSSDVLVAQSPYVSVSRNAALTQQVTATAPAGESIAYFDVIADAADNPEGKYLAIDDVSVTTPDAPQPPDLTLNPGQTVVDVLTGTSVDVPVDMNRLNGSNGDVSFSVTGLPTGDVGRLQPQPGSRHGQPHDPHPHRRRGRRPLRPVLADHGHGHAQPRSGCEPALDHQAGPHPRELRPHRALRLRRRPQRELHGQAARPLRGHERRGPDQWPDREARRRLAPDPA